MNTTPIATKFVTWDVIPLAALAGSKAYQLREKLNRDEKMNREEKNWLAQNINHNSYFKTAVPVRGYRFDFADVICKYLVNQYGQWSQYYAPDKTSLKSTLCGRIHQIVQIN